MRTILEYCVLFWTNPESNIPQNSVCTASYVPSQKPSKLDEQNMLGEVTFSYGVLHMNVPA